MVLLPTGELREYPRPATAARALEDSVEAGDGSAGWFLCDADAMGFEGPVAAVAGGEELRPGQIYFVLPADVKRNGLRREDVAALAVKASAALVRKANTNASGSGGRRRRAGSVSPLVFAPPPEVDGTLAYKTVPALVAKRRPVARVKSAGRMQPRFAPDLTAIPECEMNEGTKRMALVGQAISRDNNKTWASSILEKLRRFWNQREQKKEGGN